MIHEVVHMNNVHMLLPHTYVIHIMYFISLYIFKFIQVHYKVYVLRTRSLMLYKEKLSIILWCSFSKKKNNINNIIIIKIKLISDN